MKNSAAHTEQEYKEFLRLRAEDPAHQKFVQAVVNTAEKILERKLTEAEMTPLHSLSYMMLESLAMNWPHCTVEEVSNDLSHIKTPTEPSVQPIGVYSSIQENLQKLNTQKPSPLPLWKRILGIK